MGPSSTARSDDPGDGRLEVRSTPAGLTLAFGGRWTIESSVADAGGDAAVDPIEALQAAPGQRLDFDCSGLLEWDSVFVTRLLRIIERCAAEGLEVDDQGLPAGARRLMALARAVAPQSHPAGASPGFWTALLAPERLLRIGRELLDALAFVGEVTQALGRLARGRADMRLIDLLYFVQQAGPAALPIVTLISVLVGMILAYLGSVQLRQLGAQIYVADLVSIGMVREMGPLMTAVIMSGRTGAAYAAQLGTMQTREEIDAVTTLGMSATEFLVLPRLLALVLAMPLLSLYADALGILGGALVAFSMQVPFAAYVTEMQTVMNVTHLATGLAKSLVFGVLIAFAGCRAGMRCGRSSEAVGQAATTAVVKAIIYLVVADAAFNIVYQRLDI